MALIVPAQMIGVEQLLFDITLANMNVTTDQIFRRLIGNQNYMVSRIVANNASISLTTAAGGIYSAAAKGGQALVGAGQAYAGLNAAQAQLGILLVLADIGKGVRFETPILSLTTGQGVAATADFRIFGSIIQ